MARSVLEAHRVEITGEIRPHGLDVLPATSLRVESGMSVLAIGDPSSGHIALALALAGRLAGVQGLVTLDQHSDPAVLQAAVALVDVPGVSEPDPGLGVRLVVGEELAMAKQSAGPRAVTGWLRDNGLDHLSGSRMHELRGPDRIRMMARLAGLREPKFMVLTLPERLGGLPSEWAPALTEVTAAGIGLVVTASRSTRREFPEAVARVGQVVTLGNAVRPINQDTEPINRDSGETSA